VFAERAKEKDQAASDRAKEAEEAMKKGPWLVHPCPILPSHELRTDIRSLLLALSICVMRDGNGEQARRLLASRKTSRNRRSWPSRGRRR
jgi:hypothetical protein